MTNKWIHYEISEMFVSHMYFPYSENIHKAILVSL